MSPISDGGGTRRWTLAERILALMTALLTLTGAFFGLQAARISQAKDRVQESAENDLATLQNQIDQLEQQRDQLRRENSNLKSQLGLVGPSEEPQSSPDSSIRRKGPVVIAYDGPGIDLDSPPSDPQWSGDDTDLSYRNAAIRIGDYVLQLGAEQADYATCRNRTGYSTNFRIGASEAEPGGYFCVKTSGSRYAAIRMTQVDESSVTFDVVVYDPPES